MKFDTCLFEFAPVELRKTDFEMAMLALSSEQFARKCTDSTSYDGTKILPHQALFTFHARAVEYCENYDAFMLFLCFQ